MIFKHLPLVLFLAIQSIEVAATIITVEPDDYGAGADLSTVSPYVTLQSLTSHSQGPRRDAVRAEPRRVSEEAGNVPTDDFTFGTYGYAGLPLGTHIDDGYGFGGFGMFFNQEVSNVSMHAMNWYSFGDGLPASWAAFDDAGYAIAIGSAMPPDNSPDPFLISINVEGMRSLVIGGFSDIAAYEFDRLSFEISDSSGPSAGVPEPGMLALFAGGLMLLGASRRLKAAA